MNNVTTTPDYHRIQKEIADQQARLQKMQEFLMERSMRLEAAMPAIVAFIEANKAVTPVFNNTYSTGSIMSTDYSNTASMMVTCISYTTQGIKNIDLYIKRLNEKWYDAVQRQYNISIESVRVDGGKLHMQLRVRPN